MNPEQDMVSVEVWLQWFETHKSSQCRAYLCAAYGLNALDADALINTARIQVFRYWQTIRNPLAYFWQTLRRAVRHDLERQHTEQQQAGAYASQQQFLTTLETCTREDVDNLLEHATPTQYRVLEGFLDGYDDRQIASKLGSTPDAVRQARHAAYVAIRKRYTP
ncbi:MAG: hypothetical protein ETSY1_18050 [Candidatus Entotheonella factor]|uniref:RNA polymerase sigma factor 70 region 4 type 2 domain-containing protein n=1 Tax=Entotheonella factor TaxID=1429438 RepID=W4LMM2_ENTF1|nr:MAG: hypothetical protein ETSY1_18050 [Candidatus Entotheonella factor]